MNDNKTNTNPPQADANKDPISGTPGAHPVGVGLGAVGVGAVAGAAGGMVAGPIGAVAGAIGGAVVGAVAGKAAAEAVNPTVETKYWEGAFASRPYANGVGYEEFAPAYRYGWESYGRRSQGQTFDSAESGLNEGWDKAKGTSRLGWDKAKAATRDAWDRMDSASRELTKPAAR